MKFGSWKLEPDEPRLRNQCIFYLKNCTTINWKKSTRGAINHYSFTRVVNACLVYSAYEWVLVHQKCNSQVPPPPQRSRTAVCSAHKSKLRWQIINQVEEKHLQIDFLCGRCAFCFVFFFLYIKKQERSIQDWRLHDHEVALFQLFARHTKSWSMLARGIVVRWAVQSHHAEVHISIIEGPLL